jgi:hypothetical protein
MADQKIEVDELINFPYISPTACSSNVSAILYSRSFMKTVLSSVSAPADPLTALFTVWGQTFSQRIGRRNGCPDLLKPFQHARMIRRCRRQSRLPLSE